MSPQRGSPHPDEAWLSAWLSAFRRRERTWIVAWLVGWSVLLGVLLVWGVALGGLDRAVTAWTSGDAGAIERAEALAAAGRHAEAAELFERLDREHPARGVKHGLDQERERILSGLGAAHLALGRKGRALRAFEELVDFDDRNWMNHLALAQAAAALGETDTAAGAYDDLLAIHPRHAPSVEARVAIEFDVGRYANVPALFESYLDAYELGPVTLTVGDVELVLDVPRDGRLHAYDVACVARPDAGATLSLATRGWHLNVESLDLLGPFERGAVAPRAHVPLDPAGPWTCMDGAFDEDGVFLAEGEASRLTRTLPELSAGVARVRLELQALPPVSKDLWQMTVTSYRNLLRAEALDALRARCVVL